MIDANIILKRGEFILDASLKGSGFIGITGGNGSGKTTFLHALAGIIRTERGGIILGGKDIFELPVNRRGVVYLNQDSYFGHLDVERHIRWGIRQPDGNNQEKDVKDGLGISFSGKVSRLSMGQRARVILATAILSSPSLILIDELFANISNRGRVLEYIRDVCHKSHMDIIFVTQEKGDIALADSSYIMSDGQLNPLQQ